MGELAMLGAPPDAGENDFDFRHRGVAGPTPQADVEVLGEHPHQLTAQDQILFRRENLGFVFQQFNLLPALTAAENVAVPLFIAGVEPSCGSRKGV